MLARALKTFSLLLLLAMVAAAETIPSGTAVMVRIDSQISSGKVEGGENFHATLMRDLVVHGRKLASKGSPAKVRVVDAKSSGRLHAPGQLSLRLVAVQINGAMVPMSTGVRSFKGKSHTKSNVTKIGGGAAAGAFIGALAGGGKGALIGTAAGAGAGTAVAAATGKEEAVIPAETALSFRTTKAAQVK